MNEQELRQMIRDSIARHAGAPETVPAVSPSAASPSFNRFQFLRSGDDDGACVIEPSVRCNHCGYCQSYGH
jgi:hypothetical protein